MCFYKIFYRTGTALCLFIIIFSLLLLSSCTSTKTMHYSGFLKDYSELSPDSVTKGAMSFSQGDDVLKKYKKLIIEPVKFYLSSEVKTDMQPIDPDVINKVTTYFRDVLIKVTKEEFEVVDKPGKDVMRLRCAITGVKVTRKDLKAYQYLPIALVVVAAGEATGTRDRSVVVNLESEILDSLSGRRLAAKVQRYASDISIKTGEDLKEQDVYPVLDYWAEQLRDGIKRIHED